MTKDTRLSLSLNSDQKELIRTAAKRSGLPLSTYARDVLLIASERIVALDKSVVLSDEASRHLLEMIELPFQPNTQLAKALRRFR